MKTLQEVKALLINRPGVREGYEAARAKHDAPPAEDRENSQKPPIGPDERR